MSYATRLRAAYPFRAPAMSVDHLVIGGGVVGLSVAAGLVNTAGAGRTTFVVERGRLLGQETTARNSEVIHSGIYYPVGSLKSALCIRGRDLMYARCEALGIGHKKTEKLIVATDKMQIPYLDNLSMHTQHESFLTGQPASATRSNSVIPAYFLSGNEARDMEPELSPDVCAALLVTETGIVDSAGLVDSLAREIEEADYLETSGGVGVGVGVADKRRKGLADRGEGIIVRGTRVVRVDAGEKGGWVVQLETAGADGEPGDVEAVHADVLVNAAGLSATSITNSVVPENERVGMWISKGNYMSYKGPGASVSRLIYPCPSQHLDSLGTHLTIDLDGNVRFGPDVEHIGDDAASAANPDYWQGHLAASAAQLESIGRAAQSYLPGIDPTRLEPDYAGFRPNIRAPGGGFFDFMIRHSPARRGFVEMLGFASPGLTSSLAAGEHVARLVRADIWGDTTNPDKLAEGWEL